MEENRVIKEEIKIQDKEIKIEIGKLAKQADGAVVVSCGDTMVLVTAVASKELAEDVDFFPLSVEYREKYYAAGKIPGGFFKREGKPREKEILTSRLIDRPIRPLFPDGFLYEVQVIATVISADKKNDPDVLSIIGASAALDISDIPFNGPVGAVRVGRIDGKIVINPYIDEMEKSDIDIVVAGTKNAVTMIEGEAKEIKEEELAEIIRQAHKEIVKIAEWLEQIKAKCGKPKREVVLYKIDEEIKKEVDGLFRSKIEEALKIPDKIKRQEEIDLIKNNIIEKFKGKLQDKFEEKEKDIKLSLEEIEVSIIRGKIANEKIRPDGRQFDEIRPIECEIGIIPRAHGSALFTRGQTQALVATTLGSEEDAQILDELEGEEKKRYTLQYNFPPFSVGEVKSIRGPGRREIGHGALAERALKAVIPSKEEFPYTIQVVSDILESNGSSSMATVCGATLALMDAGVPIKKPVAGIAMGLIKENDKFIILTDIQGVEDHFGDMDFKIAGTEDGVTAIQMDIKIQGVDFEIMKQALEKAKKARIYILKEKMLKTIKEPKKELSPYAPKMKLITINKERIKDLIGPGGKNIKKIIEETGSKIDVEQDGKVRIFAEDLEVMKKTEELIKNVVAEPEEGKLYLGEVKKITNFGAFVEILPGVEGLCHISQIADERVKDVRDYIKEGEKILVKITEIDRKTGKINLSRKEAIKEQNNKE
jgi:polyribonucleotide nucleotidyltransferase